MRRERLHGLPTEVDMSRVACAVLTASVTSWAIVSASPAPVAHFEGSSEGPMVPGQACSPRPSETPMPVVVPTDAPDSTTAWVPFAVARALAR